MTKWEEWGGKRPDAVYHVIGDTCDCPSRKIRCKHVQMVERWKAEGKPVRIPIVLGLGPLGWGL